MGAILGDRAVRSGALDPGAGWQRWREFGADLGGLVDRLDWRQPEAGEPLVGLGERPVDDGPLATHRRCALMRLPVPHGAESSDLARVTIAPDPPAARLS
jgi:hypothetical protein